MRALIAIVLLLSPALASAGLWCLLRDGVELCNYRTSEACYRAAGELSGSCQMNYRQVGNVGNTRWCLATSVGMRCTFRSRRLCANAAAKVANAGCIENQYREGAAWNESSEPDSGCEAGDSVCELKEAGLLEEDL